MMNDYLEVNGMPVNVVPNDHLPVTGYVQKRTHRKNRINKKWRKRYGCIPVHDENVAYIFDNPYAGKQILVSQKVYDKLAHADSIRCGCGGSGGFNENPKDAIEAWNRRAES